MQSESEGVRHWARHTILQSQSVRVKAYTVTLQVNKIFGARQVGLVAK